MCGRYASFRQAQDIADTFAIEEVAPDLALLAPSWNIAPTTTVRIVTERADAETGEVRAGPVVGQGSVDREPDDQCTRRNDRGEACLQEGARRTALPGDRGRLLRVAGGYGRPGGHGRRGSCGRPGGQAAVLHPALGRLAPRDGGTLRILAGPSLGRGRAVAGDDDDHHDGRERCARGDPRPKAGGARVRGVGPLVGPGRGGGRGGSAAVRGGTHDDRGTGVNGGEPGGDRRSRAHRGDRALIARRADRDPRRQASRIWTGAIVPRPVSYTHLTLPT